jgi:outer membrane protein OmpA-like peptidoglycan-associated protein
MSMHTTPVARIAVLAAVTAVTLTAGGTPTAWADDPPGGFGDEPNVSVPLKKDDPDLKKVDGAELADPKVLDIKSVVESEGGDERREDSNDAIKFALQSEVLFGKDSSKLSPEADERIADVAKEIERNGATEVNVFGFTDNLGSYAHGKTLSKARAQAVQKTLAPELGSDVSYNVRGYSEDYPIADNSTEEGRKKNRRVEISFPPGD